jgi:hypothetical protein
MNEPIRNRIKGHRRVRAGDLLIHELNYRLHPELQRAALEALYREVGFARRPGREASGGAVEPVPGGGAGVPGSAVIGATPLDYQEMTAGFQALGGQRR